MTEERRRLEDGTRQSRAEAVRARKQLVNSAVEHSRAVVIVDNKLLRREVDLGPKLFTNDGSPVLPFSGAQTKRGKPL